MDRQDLDRLAYAGAEPPADLGYGDTLYFLMLRALYQFAKATDMSPERGRREKAKIEEAVRAFRVDQELARRQAETMRDTGAARAEYRKARKVLDNGMALHHLPALVAAIAAADRIVKALDNIPIERKSNGMVRSTPDNGKAPEDTETGPPAKG